MTPLETQFPRFMFEICSDPNRISPSCFILQFSPADKLAYHVDSIVLRPRPICINCLSPERALRFEFLHSLSQMKSVPLGRD